MKKIVISVPSKREEVEMPYITRGDRVVVKDVENFSCGFGGSNLKPEHLHMRGVVLDENGFGHCEVQLENGDIISCWNGKNLDWDKND